MKNLWANMKNKVPLSGTELVKAIKEVWLKEISKEYAKKNQSCDQKQMRPQNIENRKIFLCMTV